MELSDGLFQILEHQHVKPGKGRAFVRMKLRNLHSGAVVDRTFRADENVPQALVERLNHQFLYEDDLGCHFMNLDDYSQQALSPEEVGEARPFLAEGAAVVLRLFKGRALGVELPAAVELEVTEAEPGVKGDRVSGATKGVTLQTGLLVQAPLFVEAGDVIKVDTRSGAYITRV